MIGKELASKALAVVKEEKTVYMWGTFGQPVTEALITAKAKQYPWWYTAARIEKFRKLVGKGYFAFDCVGLIKGLLWDWNSADEKTNGGADYGDNGVPDIGADMMITKCKDVSTSGWTNMSVGEALWRTGHIGIYIGNGLAVECTIAWKSCVQITAVANIGKKAGYNTRNWTKHGKLPWVSYSEPIRKGDKVKVLKAKTYTGASFKVYYEAYEVMELKGDRAVIGVGGVVTAAVNVENLEKV